MRNSQPIPLAHDNTCTNITLPRPPSSPPTQPSITPPARPRQSQLTQLLINQPDDANLPYGDTIPIPKPPNTLRIYYQNIRGAKQHNRWDSWTMGHLQLQEWDIDSACLTETNTNWTHANVQQATNTARKCHTQFAAATSGSLDTTASDYQPGGTICCLHNNCTGRIIEKLVDPSGLGRWSGFRLEGKRKRNLILLSAYRPNKSPDLSNNTCYSQQWRLMRNQNPKDEPNPREQMITDLIRLVKRWQNESADIVLGIDANESIEARKSGIRRLLQETTLLPLTKPHHSPATYDRGTACIDFLLGTPTVASAVTAAGFLPFYSGAWHSDHRAIFADLNTTALFEGNTAAIAPIHSRRLLSNNSIQTKKFFSHLHKKPEWTHLEHELEILNTTAEWTADHHEQLEAIDQRFTAALLTAEQTCGNRPDHPWSPQLHEAYLVQLYWKRRVSSMKTRKANTQQLLEIQNRLTNPNQVWQDNKDRPARYQLDRATAKLRQLRADATENRKQYLLQMQDNHQRHGQLRKAKILQAIRQAEQRRRCFRTIKAFTKPTAATGGLSHILIPEENELVRVQNRAELEAILFHRNRKHFAQAGNTPCAKGPLADRLGHDGTTSAAMSILKHGHLSDHPISLPQTTTAILEELQQVRPAMPHHIPLHKMVMGLHKWRETTTTSPSGKHLGIYKTLTKAYLRRIPTSTATSNINERPAHQHHNPTVSTLYQNHKNIAHQALKIQHLLLNLAIKHTHTYQRWRVIHNFFLEKIAGWPRLDKLRVIHLYEADWNLLLKYFIAYKLNLTACKEKTVAVEQAGGRPGRNAADTATATTIANEIALLQKLAGAILYNDAKACFDRIIENISNISLMAEGLHPSIARLHAQTLREACYYIKTKYGIAPTPNGHLRPDPFLGTGQGAADSMPRWGILSDKVIKAYNKLSISEAIESPFDTKVLLEKIKAFVDDTNCRMINRQNNLQEIVTILEHNAEQWEKLLYTIGGKLELSKCKFSVYHWKLNHHGTMTLSTDCQINKITITDSESGTPCDLQEIPTNEPYKLLGVHMALDGNTRAQELALTEKCTAMMKVFTAAPLTSTDLKTGYTSVVLPTLKYGLAATNIPWYKLDEIQKPLIHAILPRMGINRHMPREVVYAPEQFGGFGLQQLSVEQGIAHIQYLVGTIRARTTDYKALLILLESYIVAAGLVGNPMENMTPIEYIDARWIETTRIFLNSINATIKIPELNIITPLRDNDCSLMELAQRHTSDTHTLTKINNCRLYLQVHTIAEISHINGQTLQQGASGAISATTNTPLLWNSSRSTLKWPRQDRPPEHAWFQWRKFLKTLTRSDNITLKRRLGTLRNPLPAHRIFTNYLPVNQAPHPRSVPSRVPSQVRWTARTFAQLTQATRIDIVIRQASSYELTAFSWSLTADTNLLMTHQDQIPPQLFKATNKGLLSGIINALDMYTQEHYKWQAAMPNHPVRMWLDCTKTIRKCANFQYVEPTASTAMREEYEMYSAISQRMKNFPHCTLHRITKQSPPPILQQFNETTIDPEYLEKSDFHASLPRGTADITVDNQLITCNTIQTLRNAYATQQYRDYLQRKFTWCSDTLDAIDWQIMHRAISRFKGKQRHILQQCIHEWLPTNAHDSQNKKDDMRKCPLCRDTDETNHHFLWCKNLPPYWSEIIDTMDRPYTPPTLKLILTTALSSPTPIQAIDNLVDTLPLTHLRLIAEQSHIGWGQLLLGRWSKQWAILYDTETKSEGGSTWLCTIQASLWKALIHKWYERCHAEHATAETIQQRNATDDDNHIDRLYDISNQFDIIDKQPFHTEAAVIKLLPLKQKKAWISRIGPHAKASLQRAKARLKQRVTAITNYFHPAPRQPLNRPPDAPPNRRANAADFHPP